MKPTWAKRKEFALFGFHSQSSGRAKLHHRNSSLRQTSSAESWKHPAHALQLSDWSVPTLENLEGSIQSKQLGQQPAEGSFRRAVLWCAASLRACEQMPHLWEVELPSRQPPQAYLGYHKHLLKRKAKKHLGKRGAWESPEIAGTFHFLQPEIFYQN